MSGWSEHKGKSNAGKSSLGQPDNFVFNYDLLQFTQISISNLGDCEFLVFVTSSQDAAYKLRWVYGSDQSALGGTQAHGVTNLGSPSPEDPASRGFRRWSYPEY